MSSVINEQYTPPRGPTSATTPESSRTWSPMSAEEAAAVLTRVATLPDVAVKVLEQVDNPEATTQDLVSLVSHDHAISAAILKYANSAFCGLSRKISSLTLAIPLLGANTIRNIAIVVSMGKLFRGGRLSERFSVHDLWRHSLAVGLGAKMLARLDRQTPAEEAFLAGLVHNLGMLAEIELDGPRFACAVNAFQSDKAKTMRQAEREAFGLDHTTLGEAVCRAWKFPNSLAAVCRLHHDPDQIPEADRLTPIVHLADMLACRASLGFAHVEVDDIDPRICDRYAFDLPQVESLLQRLAESTSEAMRVFHQS